MPCKDERGREREHATGGQGQARAKVSGERACGQVLDEYNSIGYCQ